MATRNSTLSRKRPHATERFAIRLEDAPGVVGLSATKLRNLIKAGVLPARRIGRAVLIRPADLHRLIEYADAANPVIR